MPNVHRESRIYLIVGLLFVFDQTLKWLTSVVSATGFDIVPGLFTFVSFINTNSILGMPIAQALLIILMALLLILILLLIIRYDKADDEHSVWQYSLIFAGGLSNLVDRIRVGGSIDYLELAPFPFPVFNLADVLITIGLLMLIVNWIRRGSAPPLTSGK